MIRNPQHDRHVPLADVPMGDRYWVSLEVECGTDDSVTNPRQCPSACTISSVIFFASPNSIIVFGRKNSTLSTPA